LFRVTARSNQNGATTTINQASQHLSLNMADLRHRFEQTVNFVQPGRDSIAVNRILGNSASEIYGHLNANGQVWLINPNGVAVRRGLAGECRRPRRLDARHRGQSLDATSRTFSGTARAASSIRARFVREWWLRRLAGQYGF